MTNRWRTAAIAATVALIAWAAWLWLAEVVLSSFRSLVAVESSLNYVLVVVGVIAALLIAAGAAGIRLGQAWVRSRTWGISETVLTLLAVLFSFTPVFSRLAGAPISGQSLTTALAILISLLLAARFVKCHFHLPSAGGEVRTHFYDRVTEGAGLAPIETPAQDELGRGRLVEELYHVLSGKREVSINVGLEGAWGSGKTSLLHLLTARLRSEGFDVLVFDLWSYRRPATLVRAYFERLGEVLHARAPHFQARKLVRRIAAGLIELGGARWASAVKAIYGDLTSETLEETRSALASVLRTLDRPIVVALDDLDRLDRDELTAVLRAVRLMSELPNVGQVLAYDREQIAKTLFPDDPEGSRARDYLGKIVGYELTIGNPPPELARQLLERALRPFFDAIGVDAVEFGKNIWMQGSHLVTDSLPTPREIRRIAVATLERWKSMAGHVHVFDLFVLTIIQYRFPAVYHTVRAHRDWFSKIEWSNDPLLRLSETAREEAQEKRALYLKGLEDRGDSENILAARLLETLFPGAGDDYYQRETDARKQRRIVHPGIFDRYFHLYLPEDVVSEAEIEAYEEALRAAPPGGAREDLLAAILREEAFRGRLDSFLDQWQLIFGQHPQLVRHDPILVRDLSLGLAKNADLFSADAGFIIHSQLNMAAFKVLYLLFHLPYVRSANEVGAEVIRQTSSLAFAAVLVEYSAPELRPRNYEDLPGPEQTVLQAEFAKRVAGEFSERPEALLELPRPSRAGALFYTGGDVGVGEIVIEALRRNPQLLSNFLVHGRPQRRTEGGWEVDVDGPLDIAALASVADLSLVNEATRHLGLDSWSSETDRALVDMFRRSVDMAEDD